MALGNCVSRLVAFLRAAYPTAAPAVGYEPLLALLPRRVCDDEVTAVAGKLLAARLRPADNAALGTDIGVEITRVTNEMPALDDIERVRRRLAAARAAAAD